MRHNVVLASIIAGVLSIATSAMARGPAGSFGSSPPGGGFGYQGPQFGYPGPAFGDTRTSTNGRSGSHSYGTASPLPGTEMQRVPGTPGEMPGRDRQAPPRETDY